MEIERGEIWWADLPDPVGSDPGYPRPVLVVQSDRFTKSKISTIIVAAITTNTNLGTANGNVLLTTRQSSLPRESVVNVSQLLSMDKRLFINFVGSLSSKKMEQVDAGLRLVLSL